MKAFIKSIPGKICLGVLALVLLAAMGLCGYTWWHYSQPKFSQNDEDLAVVKAADVVEVIDRAGGHAHQRKAASKQRRQHRAERKAHARETLIKGNEERSDTPQHKDCVHQAFTPL